MIGSRVSRSRARSSARLTLGILALGPACGPGLHRLPRGHMETVLQSREGMDPPALPRMKKLALANLAYLSPAKLSDEMLGELQSCATRLKISGFVENARVLPASTEPDCPLSASAEQCADRAVGAYRTAATRSRNDGLLVVALREDASGSLIHPLSYLFGRTYRTEGGILEPEEGVLYGYGEGKSDPRRLQALDLLGLGWSGGEAQAQSVRRFCGDLINRLDDARAAAQLREKQERQRQLEIERQQEERERSRDRDRDLKIEPKADPRTQPEPE